MAYNFADFVRSLESWGVTDVLLPFILIFVFVFAILQKSHILGKDKKNFNMIIALVVALSTIIPHVLGKFPAGKDPIVIIARAIPNIALLLVVGLCLFILIGLVGIKPENYKDVVYSLLTIILINIFIINAYPSIASFVLITSVYIIILSVLIGGSGLFGTIPIIAGVLVFMVFHWAATGWTQTSLPSWLIWLEEERLQGLVIILLTFFTIISFAVKGKEGPIEKIKPWILK